MWPQSLIQLFTLFSSNVDNSKTTANCTVHDINHQLTFHPLKAPPLLSDRVSRHLLGTASRGCTSLLPLTFSPHSWWSSSTNLCRRCACVWQIHNLWTSNKLTAVSRILYVSLSHFYGMLLERVVCVWGRGGGHYGATLKLVLMSRYRHS